MRSQPLPDLGASGSSTRVYVNGVVHAVDDRSTVASAVAIYQGRIIAIGDERFAIAVAGEGATYVDLHGRLVTPGLIDSHCHMALTGVQAATSIDLKPPAVRNMADLMDLVRSARAGASAGQWILGDGWSADNLVERRAPTARELDRVAPQHPVALVHVTGHSLVANTEAMLIAGLERVSNDPDGGRIDRDTSGQPTGLFIELAAMNLVLNMVPAYTTKQWEQGIREGMAEWNRYGVTATKENYPRVQFELLEIAYGALLSQGEMTIRNWLIPRAEWATEVRDYGRQPADLGEHLKVGGVKFFLDGSLAGRTAWLNDPYLPASPSSGLEYGFPQIDVDEFARAVEDATLAAIPVCVHAIGDRASDIAIEEFRRVSASHGANDIGHTLIHGLLLSEPAIFKMAELRLLLETQTPFLPVLGQAYARVIPPERLIRVIPLQSLLSNGVCVGNGSDAPTCSPDPRLGMWAAVTRSSVPNAVEDREFGRAEGVDLLKGLRTYTALAARCVGREQEIGTIEPGKRADLVIWGSDWLAGDDPAALLQAPVDATIVGGETVFLRRGAAPLDPVH